ncbi:MAG: pyruvate kinase [Flavobacteriales bacterium]
METVNKTKIVATTGPASSDEKVLREMILSGINVVRINFSHGTHKEHLQVIKILDKLDKELATCTAVIGDLQGPKLRIGEVENGSVSIQSGDELSIAFGDGHSTGRQIYINYPGIERDVQAGDSILIDDGKIILRATGVKRGNGIGATVIQGGDMTARKGVNLPHTDISLPCLTEKDKSDLSFALENRIPWIALSFVRSAADIRELRKAIGHHAHQPMIIAKIEKPQAVANIEEIIDEADGLMVARGDLGVEVPLEDVPVIQKNIVEKARLASKPVIIATQMMESMMDNLSPTRAEVNDVANAVTDSADAVMLSGETSVGKHPVEVVKTMHRIIEKAESYERRTSAGYTPPEIAEEPRFITDSICYAACRLADRAGAKAIITNTFSGYTGLKLAASRPSAPIFAFTANRKILHMLGLIRGVRGFYYDKFISTDVTIADIKKILLDKGQVEAGDLVINITSMPIKARGMSNMIKLSVVD